ncbi:MAG TPA: DSD1 family PLP-dependent enzyme [Candidatus Sumerlaeota bacterium]|nr:DSD1 family PLP-dependent enzyme [Candidatus Sumerlaeota bacterium]HPK01220.1 DSD1 family PLP-dependent enzyme [Candidatus Sumerlaeota bacterium]
MFATNGGAPPAEFTTPALLLDLDAAGRNIRAMAEFTNGKVKLRPHAKTHKSPRIARLQMEAGAIGITCATLKEAEVLQAAGIESLLLANQVIEREPIARLIELARRGEVIVAIDSVENARAIAAAARRAACVVDCLVEVDVGLGRCGVAPGTAVVELARAIAALEGLRYRGIMGYEGGMFLADPREKGRKCRECYRRLALTVELLRENQLPAEIVSSGGTNTFREAAESGMMTEIQPGSYVTMDEHNRRFGLAFEYALKVVATVLSCPEPGRCVINAGKKAVSCDEGLPVCVDPALDLFKLNEEHGHVRYDGDRARLKPGDRIEIIPSHGCTTIPLHEAYVLCRGGCVVGVEPIAARGH